MSSSRIQIDVPDVPENWQRDSLPLYEKISVGTFGVAHLGPRKLYVHRPAPGLLVVTGDASGVTIDTNVTKFRALWAELEAGAETPEKRLALAQGMTARLPCGECRQHWPRALDRLTAADLATGEAFDRWQWNEHNGVNVRKGKPRLPYEEYLRAKSWRDARPV